MVRPRRRECRGEMNEFVMCMAWDFVEKNMVPRHYQEWEPPPRVGVKVLARKNQGIPSLSMLRGEDMTRNTVNRTRRDV